MKRTALLLAGLLLIIGIGSSVAAFAHDDADEGQILAKFEHKLDKIVKECVSDLKHADSADEMDEIAQECDDEVFELLDWLEDELGHEVKFTMYDVCVTNEELGYTACFDPINVI